MPLPRRTPVTSGVPSASVAQVRSDEAGIRLGQHLARHRHVVRHRHAGERAFARERGELLRLLPAQAAAEDAAAAAQLDRHEFVVAGGEARAGEAHQHAAVLDPGIEAVARVAGDVADIGEDHHRHALLDELDDRVGGRAALGEAHVGERPERAAEIDRSRRAAAGRCRWSSR